jgi:hypothetical protein
MAKAAEYDILYDGKTESEMLQSDDNENLQTVGNSKIIEVCEKTTSLSIQDKNDLIPQSVQPVTKIQTEKQKTTDIHMKTSKHITTTANANSKAKDKRIPSTSEKKQPPKSQDSDKNVRRQRIQKHYNASRFHSKRKRSTSHSSSSDTEMSYSDSSKQSHRYQPYSSDYMKRSKNTESTRHFSNKRTVI